MFCPVLTPLIRMLCLKGVADTASSFSFNLPKNPASNHALFAKESMEK